MYEDVKAKMDKAVAAMESDFAGIRAGRANPAILDKITVDYYGTATPLAQVGTISVPDPRQLLIQPWDASILKDIEKAIQTSDIGINPTNDGNVIRLVFPVLTEERRKEIAEGYEMPKLLKRIIKPRKKVNVWWYCDIGDTEW